MAPLATPQVWAGPPYGPDVMVNAPQERPSVFATPDATPEPDAAPAPLGMPGGGGTPPVFAAPAQQAVRQQTPIEGQIDETNQRLRKLQTQDATPFGSATNHPGVGGKILHALSVAGNIAGDIFAPATMANIPGTELNRQAQEQSLGSRLQSLTQAESQNNERDAATARTTVDTAGLPQQQRDASGLSQAQTRHLDDESDGLENPQPSYEYHDTEAGPLFVNKATGVAQHVSVDGHPVGPKIQTKTVQLQQGGKPHQVLINDADGTLIKDLGESGEKPPSVNVNSAGSWQLQEGQDGKPVLFNAKTGVTKDAPPGMQKAGTFAKNNATGAKVYGPAMDSAERFNIMSQNYEDAIQNHDQQAMLSLLSNHLGMTAGLQKGGRITRDMYTEAQQSRPWLSGALTRFDSNGYLSGVTLAPEQMRQMVTLGRDKFQQDLAKAKSEADYQKVQGDGPERTPQPATMRFYLNQAKGDVPTAKKLAAQDGWSVQ